MLYLIAPELTGVVNSEAQGFRDTVVDAIGDHQDCIAINTESQLTRASIRLETGDGVGIFATADLSATNPSLDSFLKKAVAVGAAVVPIAVDRSHRGLPEPLSSDAIFAAYDWLVARDLPQANLDSVARLYAWNLLAATRPTFANPDIRIFLSYARTPSEYLAAKVDLALQALGNIPFRDNKSLRSGGPVRSAIEGSLAETDVFVLLDSLEAQQSEWVEWELLTAAKRGIPIVWVDCGAPPRDPARHHVPGPQPDIVRHDNDPDPASIADEIDRLAREKLLGAVPQAQGFIGRLGDWAGRTGATVADVDPRFGIYEVTHPLPDSRYPTRPRRDVLQVFARPPRQADHTSLINWLGGEKYFVDGRRFFDAAIMTMATSGEPLNPKDGYSVTEQAADYLASLEQDRAASKDRSQDHPTLLLFGAFPTASSTTDQVVRAARNVTATWLRLGGGLAFGGHPTITWHVVHAGAEAVGGTKSRDLVHLYQSGYWPAQPRMDSIAELATVTTVPAVNDNREDSLERMRQRMIEDAEAVAAVTIGGRTSEGGSHAPGVPDEAAMAHASGVPVFSLGATGGASAQLAAEPAGDRLVSGLQVTDRDKRWLAITDDYSGAAAMIWSLTAD